MPTDRRNFKHKQHNNFFSAEASTAFSNLTLNVNRNGNYFVILFFHLFICLFIYLFIFQFQVKELEDQVTVLEQDNATCADSQNKLKSDNILLHQQ